MDGHAGLCLSCRLDCLMDMMAPHAFAAVLRQQGGMQVDDATGKGVNEKVGHERQETCQHDELHAVLLQQRQHDVSIAQLRLRYYGSGNAQPFGTHQGIGIGLVAHDKGTSDAL